MPSTNTTATATIEKSAARLNELHAPSVLREAADLLADLWATGERHGVTPDAWNWTANLPDAALSVIASRYTASPKPERSAADVQQLQRDLIAALAGLGLIATAGRQVLVERLPESPRWGFHGDARLTVGIWTNGGWDLSWDQDRSPVVSVAAPATADGAAEVAAIVAAVVRGERPNPFARR